MKRASKAIPVLLLLAAGCGSPAAFQALGPGKARLAATASDPALPEPPSEWIPSPNFNDRPEGEKVDAVVWHHTASKATAWQTARYFQSASAKVSSHYIVDRSGTIIRCVPDDKRSWHAGRSEFHDKPNVNNFSIGIEIANVGDNKDPYPAAQVEAIVRLTAWLCRSRDIPAAHITRHRDIAVPHGRKSDTSDSYPLEYSRQAVQALLAGEPLPPAPSPARPPAGYDPGVRYHVVQPGETWQSIADDILDNPLRADELRYLNRHVDTPAAGQRIRIPTDYDLFFKLHPGASGFPGFPV